MEGIAFSGVRALSFKQGVNKWNLNLKCLPEAAEVCLISAQEEAVRQVCALEGLNHVTLTQDLLHKAFQGRSTK